MTDKDKIEVGDVVSVFFATSPMFYNATVLYTPQATGDCWHIRDQSGVLHYIQQFESIELREKGK